MAHLYIVGVLVVLLGGLLVTVGWLLHREFQIDRNDQNDQNDREDP